MRLLLAALLTASVAFAQGVPRVFISPMQGNLDGFIAAEIIKQHLPVLVVTDESAAQFVLVGLSLHEDDRWYHIAFGTFKDRNEGNVRLLNVQAKTMVWAGEAGDRSLIYGALRRGGQRKIAQRIAERMKKEYFNGTYVSPTPQTGYSQFPVPFETSKRK